MQPVSRMPRTVVRMARTVPAREIDRFIVKAD